VATVEEIWRGQSVAAAEPLGLEIPAGDARILDVRLK
jgi:hypothetical protein